jgi:hypothetical protein
MSFKLISIVFISLAITHQSLCGQNMSLVTYTYLSQTYRVRSVVMVLAVRFLRAPLLSIIYPSTTCSVTRSTLCTMLFLLSFLFALVAFSIPLWFDTTIGPVLVFEASLHLIEFPNRSHLVDNCFESESSNLNVRRDHDMRHYPLMVAGIIWYQVAILCVSSSNSIHIENALCIWLFATWASSREGRYPLKFFTPGVNIIGVCLSFVPCIHLITLTLPLYTLSGPSAW